MKEIVLKLYEFDELSKDSQERIIERERWNVMEQCMDAYDIDYKKSMEAFEDLTDTKVYGWLPVYWACALINGDYTNLSDEEEREINNFLEQAEGYPVDVDLETEGFYRCNDANDIAGSCADFIFHKCNN